MNEDFTDEPETPPEKPVKPSMAPSWVMLGFVFGALFIWALPSRESSPPPSLAVATSLAAREPAGPPRLTTIEDVFATYGGDAVWENDLTEVALWSPAKKSFAECYEVMRSGENYYFRTISRLTRPVLTHGVRPNSPLQFTEPQARRDEWLGERTQQTLRALSEAAQQNIPAPGAKPPGDDRK